MIEGHRHEKVVIVVTSYVIGFTTAFIAFGMNQLYMAENVLTTPITQTVVKTNIADTSTDKILSVTTDSEGLSAVTSKKSIILSAKKSTLDSSVIGSTELPGYHVAIIDAEVSRDGSFVYFCEQLSTESDTCVAYVYELSSDILHKVSIDGTVYTPAVTEHTSSWSDANVLSVDGAFSVIASQPWFLVSNHTNGQTPEVVGTDEAEPTTEEYELPVVN